MRRLTRALAVVGFLVLLAMVAVLAAPASVVAWLVEWQTHGTIRLADTEGSLRSGRARVTDAGGRWSAPVAWTLDAGAWWRGVLTLHLGQSPTDPVRGSIELSRNAIAASGLDVTVPAAIVRAWLPAIVALDLGGDIRISAPSLRVDDRIAQGRVSAVWTPARLVDGAGNVADFGSATVDVDAGDGKVIGRLASVGGDTALAGEMRVDGARVDADITLTPRTATPSALLRNVTVFGSAAPDGGTRFSYHGAWRGARR
ncbi:MAG: type II secretion system protein N [Betaproteobacteria bacterium]